jgi:DeoR/GlpR family transcriptional regulator of sugar metabolism
MAGRLSEIRRILYRKDEVSVPELVELTGASAATIRRDLFRLESDGVIERRHGRARLASNDQRELAFSAREQQHLAAKRRIGATAYGLLKPATTVFLDAGTTVLQLARHLRSEPMSITVVTNGFAIAEELVDVDGVRVVMLGGQLRDENLSVTGNLAEAMLQQFWFDQVFLGAYAVSGDGRLYGTDLAECSLNARTLERSDARIVLLDASKFGRRAPFAVASLAAATRLVTDGGLSAEWRRRIAEEFRAVAVAIAE